MMPSKWVVPAVACAVAACSGTNRNFGSADGGSSGQAGATSDQQANEPTAIAGDGGSSSGKEGPTEESGSGGVDATSGFSSRGGQSEGGAAFGGQGGSGRNSAGGDQGGAGCNQESDPPSARD